MATIHVDVDVTDVIRDASEYELIDELLTRSLSKRERDLFLTIFSARSVAGLLRMFRVPEELIKPVEDYFNQPVADMQALQRWSEACGVK